MRSWFPRSAPALLALLAFVVLARQALLACAAYQHQWAADLAFFTHILHNASHGRAWSSPLLLEPTGFMDMVHFHPIFLLILPLFALRPEASTLVLINVGAVCLATLPLAGLARRESGTVWFGVAASVGWLIWLPTHIAALTDFRPLVFFVPGFMLVLEGLAGRSRWRVLLGAVLVALAREESGYLLPLLGLVALVLPFGRSRRGHALVLLALGLAWFGFLLVTKENLFFHFRPGAFLDSIGGGEALPEGLTGRRLQHIGLLMMGGFGAVVLCPAMLVVLLPLFAYLLLGNPWEWQFFTGPYAHYRDVILPFLAAGGVMGWARVYLWAKGRWPRAALALIAAVLILGNAAAFHGQRCILRDSIWRRDAQLVGSAEIAAIDALVDLIPSNARVATDYRLVAALAARDEIWIAAHFTSGGGRPYTWDGEWPLSLDLVDTVLVPQDDPMVGLLDEHWKPVASGGGYGLWVERGR